MKTIEQSVKAQFSRVFTTNDWRLFKRIADYNLAEASSLKMRSLKVPKAYRLLVRNARKRLFIGIGVELLLKAAFLKLGYGINRPPKGTQCPYRLSQVDHGDLDPEETFSLNRMLEQLPSVVELSTTDGLKIAKVFRNKEGHVVAPVHQFEPDNYRMIEAALVEIYHRMFAEELRVQISMARNEKGSWQLTSI